MVEREKAASMMGNCRAARSVSRSTLYEVTRGEEVEDERKKTEDTRVFPCSYSSHTLHLKSFPDCEWSYQPVHSLFNIDFHQLYFIKTCKMLDPICSEEHWWTCFREISWLWHEFVPPALMCLGAIIDFCVVPSRACPTSPNPTHTYKHSKACCSINETWIRHEERPPSYTLTQGLPPPQLLPVCRLPSFHWALVKWGQEEI